MLRQRRVTFRRAATPTTGPATDTTPSTPDTPTTLVVNFLQYVGSGWHTTGDALLAAAAADRARAHTDWTTPQTPATAA